MDFTYVFAAVIAFLVGLLAQFVRMTRHKQWSCGSSALSLAAAFAANGIFLLNWPHLFDWGVTFAVLDLSIVAAATVLGFGAIAPYALVRIVRR